ncbi:hypothetical protein RMR21_024200 (plasmid) [Agrobacterium sp. rho-8.1]|nr:hypothetical protein [Agrobacterium sp. rho-8.1]
MMKDLAQEAFEHALERFPEGYSLGNFHGRKWGVTVKRSAGRNRVWLYAEDLAGSDIVSFNLYRLKGAGLKLKPCEMSSEKVVAFVLGFNIGLSSSTGEV